MNGEQSFVMTDEYKRAEHLFFTEQRNIFITGPAGTGKSKLLERMVAPIGDCYMACGPTGMSSLSLLNGTGETLHRAFMIPITPMRKTEMQTYYYKLTQARKPNIEEKITRIRKVSVLIIDEVSMVSAYIMDILDTALCTIRNEHGKPFGGVQVIMVGDFLQLPPVYDKSDPAQIPDQGKLAFESSVWSALDIQMVQLTKIFRQKDELQFMRMLNNVRMCIHPRGDDLARFSSLLKKHSSKDALSICYSKKNVKQINDAHYIELKQSHKDEYLFTTPLSQFDNSSQYADEMLRFKPMDDDVNEFTALCIEKVREDVKFLTKNVGDITDNELTQRFIIGMEVMLVRNLDFMDKVNGSRGRVVGFGKLECSCTPKHFDDYIETEDDDAKSSNSNNVINTQPIKHVTPCQKCRLDQPLQNDFYPIVDFDDGSSFVIPPCEYSREAILPDGTKMKTCGMTIIPLIAAWAITSHRSQGITLSNRPVHINAAQMERAFGAFYVSFSRCTSMSQVSIENFKGFQQNPVARQFYEGKYKIPSPKLYTDQQNVEFLSDERILNGFENFKDELQPTHLSSEKTSAWIKNALSSSTCSFLDLEYEMEKTIKPILREVIDKFSSLRRPKKRKREIIDRLETYIKEYSKKLS